MPGWNNWEVMQTAKQQGDRIGMLLDLDQGSMTVWKNDEKLGVMQTEALSGPYCWAVVVGGQGSSVRIEPAPAPASLTEEELTAAKEAAQELACQGCREDLGLPLTATDAECEAAEAEQGDGC